MNLLSIKKISAEKGITLTHVAEKTNMSVQNLHRCIRDGRIEAGDLEKIAKILDVPVSLFFDETSSISAVSTKGGMKLCQGCVDKEKIIRLLEDKVNYLEDRLEEYGDRQTKKAG